MCKMRRMIIVVISILSLFMFSGMSEALELAPIAPVVGTIARPGVNVPLAPFSITYSPQTFPISYSYVAGTGAWGTMGVWGNTLASITVSKQDSSANCKLNRTVGIWVNGQNFYRDVPVPACSFKVTFDVVPVFGELRIQNACTKFLTNVTATNPSPGSATYSIQRPYEEPIQVKVLAYNPATRTEAWETIVSAMPITATLNCFRAVCTK